MLKRYNIVHLQLNQEFTVKKNLRTMTISLIFGVLAGVVSYLSLDNVEYFDFNYSMMVVVIVMAQILAVVLSWFEAR